MTGNATGPMFSRRGLLSAAGAVGAGALLPGLAACSSSNDSGGNSAKTNSKSNGGGGSGTRIGKLTFGTTQIVQWDPYSTNSALHIHGYYTYLIDYSASGYKPIPAGAERWQIASDSSSVTITLRDQKFANGKVVTADDVIAGINRAHDPEDGNTLVQPTAFITKATAADKLNVKLDFEYPVSDGMILDWMFGFPLVPADGNTGAQLMNKPNGSGPYTLGDYQPNQLIKMVRNPTYWDKGRPILDEIDYRLYSDDQSMLAGLQAGDVDGATYMEFADPAQIKDQFNLYEGNGRMDIFFMNGMIPPFDNQTLRQAIARSIDRDKIIRQVRFGIGLPVYAPIMPNAVGFDPTYLKSQAFNLDAAAQLLNQSGGARSAVAALSADDQGASQMLQIIQADLKTIGFDLQIKPIDPTTFISDLGTGKLQCCCANQPNTLQTLGNVARGKQMLPTSANGMMGSHVPKEYVAAVNAANRAVSPAQQKKTYAALNKAIVDGAWAVGIATKKSLAGLKKGITGFQVDERDYIFPDNIAYSGT